MATDKAQYSSSYNEPRAMDVWGRPGPHLLRSGSFSYSMVRNSWPHAMEFSRATISAPNTPKTITSLRACASPPLLSLVEASGYTSCLGSPWMLSVAEIDMLESSYGLGISASAPIPIPCRASKAVDEKPSELDFPSFTLGRPRYGLDEMPDNTVDSESTDCGQEKIQYDTLDHPRASKQASPSNSHAGPVIEINKVDTPPPEPDLEVGDKYLQASIHTASPHTTSHAQPNHVNDLKMRFKRIGTDIVHETTVDGEIVSETWNKGTLLGAGGQGKVYKQESKTNPSQFRAVKEISSISINAKYKPAREIDTLLSVKDHSNLFVDFFGWYEDDESIYIVMEYIPHGDLSVYVKNHRELAQKEAKTITRQILEGLHVLHDMKICHRDLKPPNVLVAGINPLHLKLADFGISKDTARSELRTRSGTQRYMAPELQGLKVQHGAKRSTTYTLAVDMWALGVIVYELLTSRHPFQENTTFHEPITSCPGANNQAQSHIGEIDQFLFLYFCKGDAPLRIFPAPHMSERASDFIKKVLVADAERRMSAAAALEHEWISGNE